MEVSCELHATALELKRALYSLHRMLNGPYGRSVRFGEEEESITLPGIERVHGLLACILVTILTELYSPSKRQ